MERLKRPTLGPIVPKVGLNGFKAMSTAIGDALFTKTQQRVLGLLYGKPDARFYANEIMRQANMGRGTVRRELDRLTSAGIIVVSREGNQLYYQANIETPIYSELLAIVRKTFGVADLIRTALRPLDDRIQIAFIYGSVAKASDVKTSDIDLMVVGKKLSYGDAMDVLMPLEQSLLRPINPTIYTFAEFKTKLKQNSSFLTRVLEQPKLWVKGCDDDIATIR